MTVARGTPGVITVVNRLAVRDDDMYEDSDESLLDDSSWRDSSGKINLGESDINRDSGASDTDSNRPPSRGD